MTQTIGLKATTKHGEICITFPLLKETEKAILIRVPQIAGSGYDILRPAGRRSLGPKEQMKRQETVIISSLHLGEDSRQAPR